MSRSKGLQSVVAPERAERARSETSQYAAFRSRFDLDDTAEAVMLYLTALSSQDLTSRRVRECLQLLDLDRRVRGLTPWHQDPDVRTFLSGVFSNRPVGESHSHYDPLYLELVHAMVDACRVPTDDQRRTLVARMLRKRVGLTTAAMARLRWNDVRISKGRVAIKVTTTVGRGKAISSTHSLDAEVGRPGCPVAAIRALRALGGGEFVLGADTKPLDVNRLARLLVAQERHPQSPAQVRDPALILIGYAAALRTKEALALRQRDVATHDKGLVLSIQGRQRLTYLPSAPNGDYDPVAAWTVWLERLQAHGLCEPDGLAFRATNFSVVFERGLQDVGLNRLIHQRAEMAGLSGRFAWTSLRTGMMRAAVRNEVPLHAIAAHADLVSLGSVLRHEGRENLLGECNIARRLGL